MYGSHVFTAERSIFSVVRSPCFSCLLIFVAPISRYEDSEIELTVVDEDVMLAWAGGIPGTKAQAVRKSGVAKIFNERRV